MGKDNGGAAFPVTIYDNAGNVVSQAPGMSKRQWFAGQALPAILASEEDPKMAALRAVAAADALLEFLARGE